MYRPRAVAIIGDRSGVTCPLTSRRVAHNAYINYSQFPTMSISVLGKMETANVAVTVGIQFKVMLTVRVTLLDSAPTTNNTSTFLAPCHCNCAISDSQLITDSTAS